MLAVANSRSGRPVLIAQGKPLHSTYDPIIEARRFAEHVLRDLKSPSVIVVLGAAMGYVEEALQAAAPKARLLRVFLDSEVARAAVDLNLPAWHPDCGTTLTAFLSAHADESDLSGLRVVEWAPCTAAFGAQARKAREELRRLLRRWRASYATTAAFGPLWLRNSVANFVHLPSLLHPEVAAGDGSVLIAASGPSLNESLPTIAACRKRWEVWALPSAVPALLAAGVRPDLVVATDPGIYALRHIPTGLGVPIAMPLAAARGAWRLTDRVLLFVQPCAFERALASRLAPWSPPVVPPAGTVAASALRLALALGRTVVVFAGLDFCHRDVFSHARPNLFETVQAARADRLAPLLALLYEQAQLASGVPAEPTPGARLAPPLTAYAEWFADLRLPRGATVWRIAPTEVPTPALRALAPGELAERAVGSPPRLSAAAPFRPPIPRLRAALDFLAQCRAELSAARGQPPDSWTLLVRELAFYVDLPGLARAKAGADPAPVLDRTEAAVERLASRLLECLAPGGEPSP